MEGALIKHFQYKVPILNFLLGVIMGVVSELQSVRSQFWAIFFCIEMLQLVNILYLFLEGSSCICWILHWRIQYSQYLNLVRIKQMPRNCLGALA